MTTHHTDPQQVAAAVARRARDGFALVAVDGRAGAGKTTFAAALAARLGGPGRAAIVHGDDFLRPMTPHARLSLGPHEGYHRLLDWRRLRDEVLRPLADGRPARHGRYDRTANAVVYDETGALAPTGTVIVEGVLTARPELAAFYDLTVCVDTPDDTCLRRLYARGRGPERDAWIACWRAVEEYYLATAHPRARAGLTVRCG
ncbi:uridine kinase [Streptomyces gamaensis]|uniref:Uridine kinase n=1 Tax=Streptomyces gamaensis TaxID=1763542 RepID=A0ABW0YX74_9ACTN